MADAVIGNVQEKAMKQYGATQVEVILYSYSIGTVYLLGGQILSGNFIPAARKMFAINIDLPIKISAKLIQFKNRSIFFLTKLIAN